MKATQSEAKLSRKIAKQSQEMAQGMRKDSISMKTVSGFETDFLETLLKLLGRGSDDGASACYLVCGMY